MKNVGVFVFLVVVFVGLFAVLYSYVMPTASLGLATVLVGRDKAVSDNFEVKNIFIGDFICKDTEVLTDFHLRGLDSSFVQGSYNTQVSQQVRMCLRGVFNGGRLVYDRDDKGVTSDFLFFNDVVYDLNLDFAGGLASRVVDGRLVEIEERRLTVLGSECFIVNALVRSSRVELRFMCDGSGRVEFVDDDFTDQGYHVGGAVVNGVRVADVRVRGIMSDDVFTIASINYRVPALSLFGGGEVYIAPGSCVSEYLKFPQSMLNEFDICYLGLGVVAPVDRTVQSGAPNFEIRNAGSRGYELFFVNNRGSLVKLPLAYLDGALLRYGDRNNELFFREAPNPGAPNLNAGDYFVVNGQDSSLRDAVSCVVRFSNVDTVNNIVDFVDSGTGRKSAKYSSVANQGTLNICSGSFVFQIDPVNEMLAIDNNGDGLINGNIVSVALAGGVRLRPAGMSFDIVTNSRLFNDRTSDEVTRFNVVAEGNRINLVVPSPQASFELHYLGDSWYEGMTNYGILWQFYEKIPNRLSLVIPSRQASVGVSVGSDFVGGFGGASQTGGSILFTTAKSKLFQQEIPRQDVALAGKASFCGGGSVEGDEECDPPGTFCLHVDPVTQKSIKGICGKDCMCIWPVPVCGNLVKEIGEQCEVDEHCQQGFVCENCQCLKVGVARVDDVFIEEDVPLPVPLAVCGNQILEESEECEFGFPCSEGFYCRECMCVPVPQEVKKGFFQRILNFFRGR